MIVVIVPLSVSCFSGLVHSGGEEGVAFASLGHGSESLTWSRREVGVRPLTCHTHAPGSVASVLICAGSVLGA